MKKFLTILTSCWITIQALFGTVPVYAAQATDFIDVEDDWYTPYVQQALDLGLMSGLNEFQFDPNGYLNRAMAAVILYRMSPESAYENPAGFLDVNPEDYFYDAVNFCKEKRILGGYSETSFGPMDYITRQDLMKMIYSWALNYRPDTTEQFAPLSAFSDTSLINSYALVPIQWAYGQGIMTGSNGRLDPVSLCTRAQASKLFSLAFLLGTGQVITPEPEEPQLPQEPEISEPEITGPEETFPGLEEVPDPDDDLNDLDQNATELPESNAPQMVLPGKADDPSLTKNVKMYGIDISVHNGDMDLTPYVGQFVIIRAGYWNVEDAWFRRNVEKCEALGIPYGIYWYSYALDTEQAMIEAETCIKTIQGTNPKLGVWFDMEDADTWKRRNGWTIDHETIGSICQVFCKKLSSSGYYTGIYTSITWQKYLQGYCDPYPRWIAHWGNNNGNIHYDYSDYGVIHQYTSNPQDKNVLYINPDTMHF